MKIFLDDERIAGSIEWAIARTYGEFTAMVYEAGPRLTDLSLDHDLGDDNYDGMSCVHWLIELAMDEPQYLTGLKHILFHSANRTGVENMHGLLASAQRNGVLERVELIDYSCIFHPDHAMMPHDFDATKRE